MGFFANVIDTIKWACRTGIYAQQDQAAKTTDFFGAPCDMRKCDMRYFADTSAKDTTAEANTAANTRHRKKSVAQANYEWNITPTKNTTTKRKVTFGETTEKSIETKEHTRNSYWSAADAEANRQQVDAEKKFLQTTRLRSLRFGVPGVRVR